MKKWLLPLLLLSFLFQWLVLGQTIWSKEKILEEGQIFKFKLRPVDPNDPFRGKYLVLHYEADRFTITNGKNWQVGVPVFVKIGNDVEGFARILSLSDTPPADGHFVKAKIRGSWNDEVRIAYPFERYYLEESKASKAERLLNEQLQAGPVEVYAVIMVKKGEAVLKNIIIDGLPIEQWIAREETVE